ncbi:hypothetical protein GCM10010151_45240 [Actinoallomurus spadix]|uniref:Alpha/beta hydrolase fold-3 domain-containing protein n=1 Tax=Actinoallomurus spadix TaxID=79912 RepID=A0ABN0WYI1_9ACTN
MPRTEIPGTVQRTCRHPFLTQHRSIVLRDEGEAYAGKLRQAGVPVTAVRYQGIIHDFVMLNALRETHAAEAAISQAIATLRTALGTA